MSSSSEQVTAAPNSPSAMSTEALPSVDMAAYLTSLDAIKSGTPLADLPEAVRETCVAVATSLHEIGLVCIRDPRLDPKINETFLNMMEEYYEQPTTVKAEDYRPDMHYQVGTTPEHTEQPRNHCARVRDSLPEDEQPVTLCPPEVDPKCRFFWRIGGRPEKTEFVELNADPVLPEAFPHWSEVMNARGNSLLNAVSVVAGMTALGLGLEHDAFLSKMNNGPHLLAPTGANLNAYGELNQVLAGYHYDLNFLTIHDRSRFPGLFVWTREGKRLAVKVPAGCVLVQAGKQAEWLTGGHILGGFHEVIVSAATVNTIKTRKAEGKSLWRVSSTLFSHIQSDQSLEPISQFASEEALKSFPAIKAGNMVQAELAHINLAKSE